MIIARAPMRISLAGGGTDIAVYYERFGGMVVSTAISRYCYVLLEPRREEGMGISSATDHAWLTWHPEEEATFEPPLALAKAALSYYVEHGLLRENVNLFLAAEVPNGTGLGGSSAMAVALIAALNAFSGQTMNVLEVAELACQLEIELLQMPIGRQDQYASACGGFNVLQFSQDGVRVAPIELTREVLWGLGQRLLLFATGLTHNSSRLLAEQQHGIRHDKEKLERLHQIKGAAWHMQTALLRGKLDEVGVILDQSWQDKKKLATGITTPEIDRWYSCAREAGALGGKITGAGGGGFLLLYCPPDTQAAVRLAMNEHGLAEMQFHISVPGPQVWSYPDQS